MSDQEHIAVSKFRQYLRINTEQPNPQYYKCKDFLYEYAKEIGLKPWSYECVSGKPIVGMTLEGTDPSLPSVLLYSHTDVVPTFPDHWTYPPYDAHKDGEGKIYGRGTQDMKNEEIGSHDGIASEDDVYTLYYGQRCTWWVKVTCPGNPGHGSRFFENTPGPKLHSIIAKVTSVNITKVVGGVETNVIPPDFVAHFDLRITPTDDLIEMENLIAEWCKKAGPDVTYEFEQKLMNKTLTSTSKSDAWFSVFANVLEAEKCKYNTAISICGTDARYIRQLNIPAIGLSPMINTPILLHDHDEYLAENTFLKGLQLYVKIIEGLANVPKH
uniref:Peptidase M20 dimerisation domain-containing protein n=1 Tax=Ditylenchus dipsaci TaxID=166011 RepID=A0A915DBZ4_9BILA